MLPLLALLLTSGAHAADWSDFSSMFSTSPCQDGWVGCVVGGVAVDPDAHVDARGVPTPADLRVSWFALEGQPTFDPFAGLSRYAGEPADWCLPDGFACGDAVAEVADTDTPGRPAIDVPPVKVDPAPDRVDRHVERVDGQPDEPVDPQRDDAGEHTVEDRTPDPSETQADLGRHGGEADDADGGSSALPAGCGDRNDLERRSMTGKLTDPERACLDDLARSAPKMTDRSKASRPLIADAFARSDTDAWAKLVKRHLDEIERSDPTMALAYAQHLARGGQANAEGVVYWSDNALENRFLWTSPTFERRTLALRRLKAKAAASRWQTLAKAKAAGEPVDVGQLNRWRDDTRTFAREWYDYSVALGKPDDKALAICASASTTADACR